MLLFCDRFSVQFYWLTVGCFFIVQPFAIFLVYLAHEAERLPLFVAIALSPKTESIPVSENSSETKAPKRFLSDGSEMTHGTTVHWEVAACGRTSWQGHDLQTVWNYRADLLPLATDGWRYSPEMSKKFKSVKKENARLRKPVVEQVPDMEILKEATKGDWSARNVGGERSSRCDAVSGH